MHRCIDAQMHTYIDTYMHAYIHTYTYMNVYNLGVGGEGSRKRGIMAASAVGA